MIRLLNQRDTLARCVRCRSKMPNHPGVYVVWHRERQLVCDTCTQEVLVKVYRAMHPPRRPPVNIIVSISGHIDPMPIQPMYFPIPTARQMLMDTGLERWW